VSVTSHFVTVGACDRSKGWISTAIGLSVTRNAVCECARIAEEIYMETTVASIGPSILIKGTLIANEPLTIAGRVDGTVEIKGHVLTLAAGGRLTADVTADTIIVDGQVNGSLTADIRIVVRATATIDGDLLAPAISVADGATLNGKIETVAQRVPLFEVPRLDAASPAA